MNAILVFQYEAFLANFKIIYMNNLYNKIYEAVNAGIQKALILDPDNDVSVKFHNKEINSNIDMLPYYLQELYNAQSQEEKKEAYTNIKKYAEKTESLYKISDIHELADIFYKLLTIKGITNKNANLKWVDTTGVVELILKSGKEVPLHTIYDKNKNYNESDINFIKINFINDCGHYLILNKNLFGLKSKEHHRWTDNINIYNLFDVSHFIKNLDDAKKDFNGWKHTYENRNIPIKEFENYPALDYINSINIDSNYKAYIPAYGELHLMSTIEYLFNHILYKIGTYRNERLTYMSLPNNYLKVYDYVNCVLTSTEYNEK